MAVQAATDAIAEPQLREILRLVGDHELPPGAIASEFADVTRPRSRSTSDLLSARLLTERRAGTRRLERARNEGLRDLGFAWGFEEPDMLVRPGSTTMELTLEPDDGGTLLRLTHRDPPSPRSRTTRSVGRCCSPAFMRRPEREENRPDRPAGSPRGRQLLRIA